ncbi:MAG: hypothetical protein AB8G86_26780 [Saprospiraceae bacterium]
MIGAFGEADLNWKFLSLLVEYDAQSIHTGLKANIKNLVFLQATLLDGKSVGGSISLRWKL